MKRSNRGAAVVLPLVLAAGCGVVDGRAPEYGSVQEATIADNGEMQNGEMQNGEMQNGEMQNGASLQLTGVTLKSVYRLVVQPSPGGDPSLDPRNLVLVSGVK